MNKNNYPKTQSNLSQFGFGTYRLTNSSEHKTILKKAIQSGINLIDTATNYHHGDAEIAIGNVIQELIYDNDITREEVTIISKAGYLEGKTYTKYSQTFNNITHLSQQAGHCIDPKFLETQLSESLLRLNLDYLDAYLIQNPEIYFINNKNSNEETYYKQIKEALLYLETEVKKGRIHYYGISSNTFDTNQTNTNSTSLNKLLEIVKEIPNHHFKIIQCPFNLIEHSLAKRKNAISFFELAHNHNLDLITNRPLNAMINNQLFKLVDVDENTEITDIEIDDLIQNGLDHEASLKTTLKDKEIPDISPYLTLFEKLNETQSTTITYFTFKGLLEDIFIPQIDHIISLFEEFNLDSDIEHQFLNYFSLFNHTAKELSHYYKQIHQTKIIELKATLPNHISNDIPIHTIALQSYKNTPYITATLIGITHEEHLESALNNLKHNSITSLSWNDLDINTALT